MKLPLLAKLAFETSSTCARLTEAGAAMGLEFEATWNLREETPDLEGARFVFVEDPSSGDTLRARTQSFAAAMPSGLLVMMVPFPRELVEDDLMAAGAFAVIDDGPELKRHLSRILHAARRYVKQAEEHTQLSSELAHQDRLSALGVLAAGVGHEVNNPCTAILANATVIRDQLENLLSRPRYQQAEGLNERAGDWLEALGDCIGASRRITSIVKTLNVFSRKSPSAEPEPVHLNEVVQSVLRLVGKEIRFQASVDLLLDEHLPPVSAQPHSMMQVVTNLIVNAIHALEETEGTRCLTIRTSHDEECVLMEVTDSGPGIAPETIGRIFDPFFTTKAGKGSGLGLAITRELVTRAGGEIFVESEPGEGTLFRVVLPRPPVHSAEKRTPSVRPAWERLRVMIVDDDAMLLRSITRSLDDRFECIPVNSAAAALSSLDRDDRIDVLVTDIVMPGENGVDLYEQLVRDRPHLASRTIFFSGGVSSEALQAAILRTGRPLLGKPIDMLEFVRTVRDVAA